MRAAGCGAGVWVGVDGGDGLPGGRGGGEAAAREGGDCRRGRDGMLVGGGSRGRVGMWRVFR